MLSQLLVRLLTLDGKVLLENAVQFGTAMRIPRDAAYRLELIDQATGKGPAQVELARNGQNLVIRFETEQQTLVITDYYDQAGSLDIVGQTADGQLLSYLPPDQLLSSYAANLVDGAHAVQFLGGKVGEAAVATLALQPLVAGVAGLAAAAGGGGGGSVPPAPTPLIPGPTELGIHDSDGDGYPNLTGTGEPGTTISVTTPGGQTFTGTVDGSGNWNLNLPGVSPVTGTYSVTNTDGGGNTSGPGTISVDGTTDLTAPEQPSPPSVRDSDGNGDPEIEGTAEPASTVTVTAPNGATFTVLADGSGHYRFEASGLGPVTGTYSVTSTDSSGNTSIPNSDSTSDLSAPMAPGVPDIVDSDGDGQADISGRAEPNSTVTVKAPNGATFTVAVDGGGRYALETSGLSSLEGTYSVSARDPQGNVSPITSLSETDLTAPTVSITDLIDSDGDGKPEISGTAEVGATVSIHLPGSTTTFTAVADASGNFSAELSGVSPLTGTYSVSATDAAGNSSAPVTSSEVDLTAPVITFNGVADDDVINAAEKTAGVTISGTATAESGQTITVSWVVAPTPQRCKVMAHGK